MRDVLMRALHYTHQLPVRVYYEDTDFSGVVYHASYLRFLERGRTELLRTFGIDQSALHLAGGAMFAVRRISVDYLKPARMDDCLTVESKIERIRGASFIMKQSAVRDDLTLVTANIEIAYLCYGRPTRLRTERSTF